MRASKAFFPEDGRVIAGPFAGIEAAEAAVLATLEEAGLHVVKAMRFGFSKRVQALSLDGGVWLVAMHSPVPEGLGARCERAYGAQITYGPNEARADGANRFVLRFAGEGFEVVDALPHWPSDADPTDILYSAVCSAVTAAAPVAVRSWWYEG